MPRKKSRPMLRRERRRRVARRQPLQPKPHSSNPSRKPERVRSRRRPHRPPASRVLGSLQSRRASGKALPPPQLPKVLHPPQGLLPRPRVPPHLPMVDLASHLVVHVQCLGSPLGSLKPLSAERALSASLGASGRRRRTKARTRQEPHLRTRLLTPRRRRRRRNGSVPLVDNLYPQLSSSATRRVRLLLPRSSRAHLRGRDLPLLL